jgi:EmrB/QacA subfamily drug resistance transporter
VAEAMSEVPGHARRRWIFLTIGTGTFMSALDGSVVNTVLPLLRRELHTSVAGIEWVTTVYLLVVSALLLGVGRLGDLKGHKRIYLGGLILFTIGSALCGLAPTAGALIGLRALQAIGAAMLFSSSPAILTRSFPPQQRGRVLGAQGTMTYLGLMTGPVLGGWLADSFGWRWIFYINVPIGLATLALGVIAIQDGRGEGAEERFDFRGALLFTTGLVALLVALNQGHAWGWGSAPILLLLGTALISLVDFVRVESRSAAPMLDLSLFRNRVFSAASVSALLNYVCVYSILFIGPFLLIQGRGLDTQQAGIVLTAQPLVMAIVAPISGALSDRIGSRLLSTVGMILLAAGLLLLALLAPHASLRAIAGALALIGLGTGIFVSPNNSALMGAAPRHRQGIASGVLATARNVGMVLGVGMSGAVFTTILTSPAYGSAGAALVAGVRTSLLVAAAVALVGAGAAATR